MKPKFICFSGKAGSGKDTSALIMKQSLEESGKSVLITHYADLLKYICRTFGKWDGKKDANGREMLQYIGTDMVRKNNPNYWVDFIIDMVGLFGDIWDYVIIADARFPNELNRLKNSGYYVTHIRIKRDNHNSNMLTKSQENHESETALDNVTPDFVVPNNEDLYALAEKIRVLSKYMIEHDKSTSNMRNMLIKAQKDRKSYEDELRSVIESLNREAGIPSTSCKTKCKSASNLFEAIVQFVMYDGYDIDSLMEDIESAM